MNAKGLTANPLLVGLLVLLAGAPSVLAGDDAKSDAVPTEVKRSDAATDGASRDERCQPKPLPPNSGNHDMSPEAKLLPGPTDPNAFKPDPCYTEPYDAAAELEIFSGKTPIDRPRPPIELGRRLYDRGAYPPAPTWFGGLNPLAFHFMTFCDFRIVAAHNDNGRADANGE